MRLTPTAAATVCRVTRPTPSPPSGPMATLAPEPAGTANGPPSDPPDASAVTRTPRRLLGTLPRASSVRHRATRAHHHDENSVRSIQRVRARVSGSIQEWRRIAGPWAPTFASPLICTGTVPNVTVPVKRRDHGWCATYPPGPAVELALKHLRAPRLRGGSRRSARSSRRPRTSVVAQWHSIDPAMGGRRSELTAGPACR